MRAVQAREFGGPEVLGPVDVPEPVPGSGELLVSVEAAGVLFLDTQLRAGWGREFFDITPPFVPGAVVAGTVLDAGADADPAWRGRRVAASTSGPGAYRGGGYAERALAPAGNAHLIPDGLDTVAALAAHDGVMAVSRIARSGLTRGDTALVTAASGSIGTWLVPMLRDAGVRVVAAAHGRAKTDLAARRGADAVVDYSAADWTSGLPEVAAVFDGAGGALGSAAFGLVGPGGRFFSYGAAAGDFPDVEAKAAERGVEVVGIHDDFTADDMHRAMADALRILAEGRVTPVIGQRLPLEQAAAAHAAMDERRVLGKTVLVP